MSAETIPRQNAEELSQEREQIPTLSYEEYRAFCDEAQPDVYRKTGIDSRENYEAALENPDTTYIEIEGQRLPLFVPLENAGGYNVEGSRGLTGKDRVFAMAIPPHLLEPDELSTYLTELGEDVAVIVETGAEQTHDVKEVLTADLAQVGWKVGEFLEPDSRIPEKNRPAWMAVYMAGLEALDKDGNLLPSNDRSLKELSEEDMQETGDVDTTFVTAQELRDNDELFDQLWDLHNDRFDWLGKYHPVSMQETKSFFKQVVSDDHTTSIVRFDYDGNGMRTPVAHGCFIDNLDLVEWINDDFKQKVAEEAEANNEKVQFFYGIASIGSSNHYAKDVMQLHSRIDQRAGGKIRLLFESTNKSSMYIPRMVGSYVSEETNGLTVTERIQSVSRLDYWYLSSESNETV